MRSVKISKVALLTSMYPAIFCVLQLARLVTGNAEKDDSGRYLIDSRPILFVEEPPADAHIVNSTLVVKKKTPSIGPVYFNTKKPEYSSVSNHHVATGDEVVWRPPHTPLTEVISNHKGTSHWNHKWFQRFSSTPPPKQTTFQQPVTEGPIIINNHQSNKYPNSRPNQQQSVASIFDTPTQQPQSIVSILSTPPQQPQSVVSILDTPPQQAATDIIGDRIKQPDIVKSATINVLDAPSNLRTTIKTIQDSKIIVIQKRTDKLSSNDISNTIHSGKPNKSPHRGNFSVAPVMDPWSNIPFPSKPSWVPPVKGSAAVQPAASQPAQSVVPHLPFMPFLSSLIMPLLSKPLTPSAMNSGMQGIKAMQGFLRNSLMGAMFCFLPSAFIALSLTATQRTEVRKTPEMDDMIFYCKKCLENLKKIKEFVQSKDPNWLNENS